MMFSFFSMRMDPQRVEVGKSTNTGAWLEFSVWLCLPP